MKAIVVTLSSVAAILTGVFIRSCQSIPAELQAWCGAPPHAATLAQHQHCLGCALVVAGLMLGALSLVLSSRTRKTTLVTCRR